MRRGQGREGALASKSSPLAQRRRGETRTRRARSPPQSRRQSRRNESGPRAENRARTLCAQPAGADMRLDRLAPEPFFRSQRITRNPSLQFLFSKSHFYRMQLHSRYSPGVRSEHGLEMDASNVLAAMVRPSDSRSIEAGIVSSAFPAYIHEVGPGGDELMNDISSAGTFPLGGRIVKRPGLRRNAARGTRSVRASQGPRCRDSGLAGGGRERRQSHRHQRLLWSYVTNKLIREALHPYPDDLVIVTKIGARRGDDASWNPAMSPDDLKRGA